MLVSKQVRSKGSRVSFGHLALFFIQQVFWGIMLHVCFSVLFVFHQVCLRVRRLCLFNGLKGSTQCLSIFPAGRILLPLATEWSFIVMLSRPSHPVDLLSGWPEGVKIEAAISTSAKDKRYYGLIDSSIQSIFWLTSNIQSVGRVDKESTTISSLFRTRA